jgi:hypothetical protein
MCDKISGLKQYKNSCWFDSCLIALFVPDNNFAYFQHIYERTEYGHEDLRLILKQMVKSMRNGSKFQPEHSLHLSNLMVSAKVLPHNTLKENSARDFLTCLLEFGRFPSTKDYIITYSGLKTKTYLADIFNKKFPLMPKYLIIESLQNTKFIPSNELDVSDIKGNKVKLYLNSILTLKGNHYITYLKCGDGWYVYDGERAKDGFPLSKMSYFNVRLPNDKFVTELHAVSTSKKTFVYDYTNTIDSVNAYFIYTQKI